MKILVEKHDDGYVAYPVGMKGVIVGEGDSYDAALDDVKSAIRFHVETFGSDALGEESPLLDAPCAPSPRCAGRGSAKRG